MNKVTLVEKRDLLSENPARILENYNIYIKGLAVLVHRDTFMNKNSGMTLSEILIVLAIIGVLSLISMGPLMSMIRGQRVKTAANEVFSSLLMARAEALKRNSCVNVVPVDGSNWSLGWSVQVPTTAGLATCGGTGTPIVVRRYGPETQVTVSGPSTTVAFTGAGRLSALGDSSTASLCNNVCTSTCTVNNAPPSFRLQLADTNVLRCVSVRSSGAPEVKKG